MFKKSAPIGDVRGVVGAAPPVRHDGAGVAGAAPPKVKADWEVEVNVEEEVAHCAAIAACPAKASAMYKRIVADPQRPSHMMMFSVTPIRV